MSEFERIKCLIIGSGPGGYTAAIYAARADFEALIENNGILRINNATLKGNALVEGAVLVKGNEVLEVI